MKKLDTSSIPKHIKEPIEDMLADKFYSDALQDLTVEQALDQWLRWNGIIGWTGQILETVQALQLAAAKARTQNAMAAAHSKLTGGAS